MRNYFILIFGLVLGVSCQQEENEVVQPAPAAISFSKITSVDNTVGNLAAFINSPDYEEYLKVVKTEFTLGAEKYKAYAAPGKSDASILIITISDEADQAETVFSLIEQGKVTETIVVEANFNLGRYTFYNAKKELISIAEMVEKGAKENTEQEVLQKAYALALAKQ